MADEGTVQSTAGRFWELEGIRGWAALSVVVYHIVWETFGLLWPQLRNPLTGFFLDGGVDVSAFFVLSGEALSAAFFGGGGRQAVYRLALKRYTRLTIPVVAACALTLMLYQAHLTYNVAAGHVVHRSDWLGVFIDPPPNLLQAVQYMLLDVYASVPFQHAVIPFLWTMRFELQGSVLVFGVLLGLSRLRGSGLSMAWLFIGLLFAATIYGKQDELACFLAGVGFARLRSRGVFARLQSDGRVQRLTWIAIAVIGTLDGFSDLLLIGRRWVPLASVLLVLAVLCNRRLCAAFATRLSRSLGRISFALYLVQFPVLVSFTSYSICYAARHGVLDRWGIVAISAASVLVCLMAAYAFRPIERLTHRVGNGIVALVMNRGSDRPAKLPVSYASPGSGSSAVKLVG